MFTRGQVAEAAAGIGAYASKSITVAGGTTDPIGDDGGALDPLTLFTVTGTVLMKFFATCTVDLASAGGGTVSVGTALSAAGLLASTTATAIVAKELWHDNSPDGSI